MLSDYGELASPQINTFHSEDIYAYPPNFSFRFKDKELSGLYKELTNVVSTFQGNLKWIMHNYGSRKNYTIEPLEFFHARRIVDEQQDSTVKTLLEGKYEEICQKALLDISPLCEHIKSQVK